MDNIRILGVDPGSVFCGYAVIEKNNNHLTVIEYGVIRAKKKYNDLNLRLKEIYERLSELIKRTSPDESAFETMFYSKNAQSLMKLSHARASAILSAVMENIPVFEYSPREIKKSVTGRGNASKEQVQYMIKNLLQIKETPDLFDISDALAIAICHSIKRDMPKASTSSWKEFINKNPDRLVKF